MEITIKKSKIHGKGIFADKDFKKGDVVVKHKFKSLTKKEYENLPEKEKHFVGNNKGKYKLFLPPSRYMNHSCNPNTKIRSNSDIAIRNIKKGEEITSYYSDDDLDFKMKCKCGSEKCKKVITNK